MRTLEKVRSVLYGQTGDRGVKKRLEDFLQGISRKPGR